MRVYGLVSGGGKIIIKIGKKKVERWCPCAVYKWNNMLLKWSIQILMGMKRLALKSIDKNVPHTQLNCLMFSFSVASTVYEWNYGIFFYVFRWLSAKIVLQFKVVDLLQYWTNLPTADHIRALFGTHTHSSSICSFRFGKALHLSSCHKIETKTVPYTSFARCSLGFELVNGFKSSSILMEF